MTPGELAKKLKYMNITPAFKIYIKLRSIDL
jgi:hypothetical protein